VLSVDDLLILYIVQAPMIYLTVWLAVDCISVVFIILFWIIQRYVFAVCHFQTFALETEVLNSFKYKDKGVRCLL